MKVSKLNTLRDEFRTALRVCPHRASASVAAAASPSEYIVMLGNQFSSVTMYSNGAADAATAADAQYGQTLRTY